MRILGVDPGLAKLGWGMVEKHGNRFSALAFKTIKTSSKTELPVRLTDIYDQIREVIEAFKPEALAIEKLFFHRNVSSALVVGQVRGIIILAAHQGGLEVYEYTPLQIKQAVVGYGRAEKQQMQKMVQVILNLRAAPRSFDAADALGAAICHLQQERLISLTRRKD